MDVKFEGRGCAISQASASMLTEMVIDKPLTNVKDIDKTVILENIGLTNLGPARVSAPLSTQSNEIGYGELSCIQRSRVCEDS